MNAEPTMCAKSLLQEALDLTRDIVNVNIETWVVPENGWHAISYSHLALSRKTLMAIHLILSSESNKAMLNPGYILVRHLFELAADLEYMEKRPEEVHDFLRLSEYRAVLDLVSDQRLEDAQEQLDLVDYPKGRWKPLADICAEVGLSDIYKTLYRFTSEKSHGGHLTMTQEFLRMLNKEEIPDWKPASVIRIALTCYLSVLWVNFSVFPCLRSDFANFLPGTDWRHRLGKLDSDIEAAASP